jgi:hypothetical protein
MTTLRLPLQVIRDRGPLDTALAEGVQPDGDSHLAVRARALSSPQARRRLATTIGDLLDAAEKPPDPFGRQGSQPPLQRESIRAARPELQELAARLQAPHPIPVQAIALTALLVWDAASPVYTLRDDATVIGWALAAVDAAAAVA